MAAKSVTHGPLAAGKDSFNYEKWATSASADEVSSTVSSVAGLLASDQLSLWVEKYPVADFEYASKRAAGPFPGFRAMVLDF